MPDQTTDPRDGQPCAANVDTATVDAHTALMAALAAWREDVRPWVDQHTPDPLPAGPHTTDHDLAAAYDAYMAAPKPATVDGADLAAFIYDQIEDLWIMHDGDPDGGYWLCEVSADNLADRISGALTAAGWPDGYQPDNPHVTAAREARAEVERLTGQLAQVTRERDDRGRVLTDVIGQREAAYRARDDARRERDAERERANQLAAGVRSIVARLDAAEAAAPGLAPKWSDRRVIGAELRALLDGAASPAPSPTTDPATPGGQTGHDDTQETDR